MVQFHVFYSPEDLQRRDQEPPSDVPLQEERRLQGPVRHRQLHCEGERLFVAFRLLSLQLRIRLFQVGSLIGLTQLVVCGLFASFRREL